MADTAAALVIQLSADVKQFQKEMRAATGVFDAEGRKIERRQAQLKKNLSDWSGIGKGLGKIVIGGAALAGIERFVSSIVEAGSALQDTSDAIGVGTDELQAWGLLAERAGIKQETFNTALDKFSKSIGDAAIKGGSSAKFFKALGVDVKGDVTTAFYQFADAVAKTGNVQQQTSLVTTVFGKRMANLRSTIAEGSRALKDQVAQIAASGQIISRDTVPKIDALGDAWSDLKRQFIATGANSLAGPLQEFTKQLADPKVQSGIKVFAELLAQIAVQLAKAAKYAPIVAGAFAGFRVGRLAGPIGGAVGAFAGGVAGGSLADVNTQTEKQINNRLANLRSQPNSKTNPQIKADIARLEGLLAQRKIDAAAAAAGPSTPPAKIGGLDRTDLTGEDAAKRAAGQKQLTDLAVQDAKRLRDATLSANDDIRDSNLDALKSRQDSITAQDEALLSLSQGTEDYYTLQKQVIIELAGLDIEYTKRRTDAALASIAERSAAEDAAAKEERDARKAQLALLQSEDKISPSQAAKSLKDFDISQAQEKAARDKADADRRITLEQDTASQIVAINAKKNADLAQSDEDLTHARADAIQVTDALRSGLEDIGAASLHGFGSMKDAAKNALEQIAELILRLYVLKPLVESILGPAGTTGGLSGLSGLGGGGGGGDFLGTIAKIGLGLFGFAKGGVMTPNGPRRLRRFAGGGVSNSAAIFGEAGPEAAIPLPDGRSVPVTLRLPKTPSGARAQTIAPVIQIDARYATRGVADEIEARLRDVTPQIIAQAVKNSDARFAGNMRKANRDVF